MTLRTELEKLVRIHGIFDVMSNLTDIIDVNVTEKNEEIEELTSKVRVLEDDLESAISEATYWEASYHEGEALREAAQSELHDIRNNFSTLIKTVYEEEDKLNG